MALTVEELVRAPGLDVRVLAGRAGLGREVRWAHVTELSDPVPWLRGGELLLTVGLGIGTNEDDHRRYVERLCDAGCAGLGFALDTWIDRVPAVIVDTADHLGLPLLHVRGTTPFVALVEAVAEHYARERLHDQHQVLHAQDAMARSALRLGAPGVLRALATAAGGDAGTDAVLLDANGMVRESASESERPWHAMVRSAVAPGASRAPGMTVLEDGAATVLLQSLGVSGTALGWLALRCASPLSPHTRMLANHAASLLALDLQWARAERRERQRQRAGPLSLLLDENTAADADPDVRSYASRLITLPDPPFEVVVFPVSRPDALRDTAADTVTDVMGDTRAAERVAMCAVPGGLAVVLPGIGDARPRLGERLFTALGGAAPVSAGACDAHGIGDLRAASVRAQRAAATGHGYRHVADTDMWALLLRGIDPAAAAEFRTEVLGRLREHDARNSTELVGSLRSFLEHDGSIEATARTIGVHRNTLRARMRTAERVSGRPLTSQHRLELQVALALEE